MYMFYVIEFHIFIVHDVHVLCYRISCIYTMYMFYVIEFHIFIVHDVHVLCYRISYIYSTRCACFMLSNFIYL